MRFRIFFAFLALLAVGASLSAMAQSSKSAETIAAVSTDSSQISWLPHVDYERLVLTVSAPTGEVFHREFKAGKTPSFEIADQNGDALPDGTYLYELRVVPNLARGVKETLKRSRVNGDSDEVQRQLKKSGLLPETPLVQSGSFIIEKGSIVKGGEEEPRNPGLMDAPRKRHRDAAPPNAGVITQDQVIADDLIVQGSACVGLDCVNNESFGFDTIRLKENNTRIKFDDTSTAAGFPANDWQLTANDSANGGASKFSIEDITGAKVPFTITAGATTNSIFVSSTGRVGFRTSTPVLDLHVLTGDTPAFRMDQNATGGFTAQIWDVAGNEANFFVRDVTGGSRLPFRIRPGAPTSSIDISAAGNVGIRTASPSGALHIANNGPQWSASNYGTNLIVKDGATARNPAIGIFDAANTNPWAIVNTAGVLRFSQMPTLGDIVTTPVERVVVNAAGNVGIGTSSPLGKLDVNGTIFQRGIQLFADYVFEPDYTLESIEDHAAFMWNNKHLPAVGARKVDEQGREVVEIGARMRGMLEELEKAHIYISTLNAKVAEKDVQLAKLAQQNAELAERLARIEALLSASNTVLK